MAMIVLDKSFLQTHSKAVVRQCLKGHQVILPSELFYEVATDGDGNPASQLFNKLDGLDVCKAHPVLNLAIQEIRTNTPSQVIDEASTKSLKTFLNGPNRQLISGTADSLTKSLFESDEPQRLRDGLERMWEPRFEDTFKEARKLQADKGSPAKAYVKLFGSINGHGIAEEHKMNAVPSPGWVIYEWERLRNFLAFRYRLSGARPCDLPNKTLANALLDVCYAALLAGADGIATEDGGLVDIVSTFLPHKTITRST